MEERKFLKDILINNQINEIKEYFNNSNINISLTEQGSTPLMILSSINNLNIIQYFIQYFSSYININQSNLNGSTALIFACNSGNILIVDYLCNYGANINCIINSGDTPLTISSSNGNNEIVSYLCNQKDIQIDHINNEGKTALLCAIEEGYISIVSILLKFGANVNLVTETNISNKTTKCSPLVLACLYDEFEIVKILLQYGADTSLISDFIISSQLSPKYTKFEDDDDDEEDYNDEKFQQKIASIPIPTENRLLIRSELLKYGWLPRLDIKRCCELDDINTFQRLLNDYQYSSEILSLLTNSVITTTGGATCLLLAALYGSTKIVSEIFKLSSSSLYSQHINLRYQTNDGRNVLFYTVYNGHSNLLTYLLQNGLSDMINQVNNSGESPLYYACLNGHVDCVRILIENGCYISTDKITSEIICQNMTIYKNSESESIYNVQEISLDELKEVRKKEIMRLLS